LKLALLSHYWHDIIAVSHTWLDFFGDEVDFVRGAFSHLMAKLSGDIMV
jgi:hypothetical protein